MRSRSGARPAGYARARGRTAWLVSAALLALATATAAGCATSPPRGTAGAGINVVAAENSWGSLAAQLGGGRARVTSIIDKPDVDPHEYEPTAADGRAIAAAQVVIINGIGYDPWATKLTAANPADGRTVVTVGTVVGAARDANPHRWYNPDDVRRVIDAITAAYGRTRPADATFYAAQRDRLLGTDLKDYFDTVTRIRTRYAGTPVGASESIAAMLTPALGLHLLTPPALLSAVSEGAEPTAADKAAADAQIRDRLVRVFIVNSQNTTPDVRAQVDAARARSVPVVAITETPTPAGITFQNWQVNQLRALEGALSQATGR